MSVGFASLYNLDVCAVGHGNWTMSFNVFQRDLPGGLDSPYDQTPNANDAIVRCSHTLPGPSPANWEYPFGGPIFHCVGKDVDDYHIVLSGYLSDSTPKGSIGILASRRNVGALVKIPVSGFRPDGTYTGPNNLTTYSIPL